MPKTTLRVPEPFADLLRYTIKEEMAADANEFPARGPEKLAVEEILGKVTQHRDALDQLEWEWSAGRERDVEITAESAYLVSIFESVLSSISDTIAGIIGEYRDVGGQQDRTPIDFADLKQQVENLEWFAQGLEGIEVEPSIPEVLAA